MTKFVRLYDEDSEEQKFLMNAYSAIERDDGVMVELSEDGERSQQFFGGYELVGFGR